MVIGTDYIRGSEVDVLKKNEHKESIRKEDGIDPIITITHKNDFRTQTHFNQTRFIRKSIGS